jgi:hypothetical protein
MVKTWRYSSIKEFEQTMLSISDISLLFLPLAPPWVIFKRHLAKITCPGHYRYTNVYLIIHSADYTYLGIYSLRWLTQHWMCHISYLHNTEIYFFSHVLLLFQFFHHKNRKSYYFLLLEEFWLLSKYSLQNELWDIHLYICNVHC